MMIEQPLLSEQPKVRRGDGCVRDHGGDILRILADVNAKMRCGALNSTGPQKRRQRRIAASAAG